MLETLRYFVLTFIWETIALVVICFLLGLAFAFFGYYRFRWVVRREMQFQAQIKGEIDRLRARQARLDAALNSARDDWKRRHQEGARGGTASEYRRPASNTAAARPAQAPASASPAREEKADTTQTSARDREAKESSAGAKEPAPAADDKLSPKKSLPPGLTPLKTLGAILEDKRKDDEVEMERKGSEAVSPESTLGEEAEAEIVAETEEEAGKTAKEEDVASGELDEGVEAEEGPEAAAEDEAEDEAQDKDKEEEKPAQSPGFGSRLQSLRAALGLRQAPEPEEEPAPDAESGSEGESKREAHEDAVPEEEPGEESAAAPEPEPVATGSPSPAAASTARKRRKPKDQLELLLGQLGNGQDEGEVGGRNRSGEKTGGSAPQTPEAPQSQPEPQPKSEPASRPAPARKKGTARKGDQLEFTGEFKDSLTHLDPDLGEVYFDRPEHVDDLKKIKGIGPVLEQKLHKFGVYRYYQIAAWTPENARQFADRLREFPDRIDRDRWVEQARKLAG